MVAYVYDVELQDFISVAHPAAKCCILHYLLKEVWEVYIDTFRVRIL